MNIVICDDERHVREQVKNMVKNFSPEAEIFLCADGEGVLRRARQTDILLLDIELAGENGMTVARRFRAVNRDAVLIFVTGMEEYVFDAFDVGAFHYLVKPFSKEKFLRVMERAYEKYLLHPADVPKDGRTILVQKNGVHRKIVLDDIVYAEVFNRLVMIHELHREFEYYGKLSELEAQAGDTFFRPHRSYLINMKHVEKYDGTHIVLSNGEVPIARARYTDFVKAFLRYMKDVSGIS